MWFLVISCARACADACKDIFEKQNLFQVISPFKILKNKPLFGSIKNALCAHFVSQKVQKKKKIFFFKKWVFFAKNIENNVQSIQKVKKNSDLFLFFTFLISSRSPTGKKVLTDTARAKLFSGGIPVLNILYFQHFLKVLFFIYINPVNIRFFYFRLFAKKLKIAKKGRFWPFLTICAGQKNGFFFRLG